MTKRSGEDADGGTDLQGQFRFFDSPLARDRVQNDRRMALWNLFHIGHERSMEPILVTDGRCHVEVNPSRAGLATQGDKDLLIYGGSLVRQKIARGEPASPLVEFTAYDYLAISHKTTGGSAYRQIKGALDRLTGTQIKTDIETGGEAEERWFTWLKSAKITTRRDARGQRVMRSIAIELCDWLYRAVLHDDQMLIYAGRYFDLTPTERRIYEIMRGVIGAADGAILPLEALHAAAGVGDDLRRFKHCLSRMTGVQPLPGFHFALATETELGQLRRGIVLPARRARLAEAVVAFWPAGRAANLRALVTTPSLDVRRIGRDALPRRMPHPTMQLPTTKETRMTAPDA